jgi:undecaprenyl-diphosphatase
VSDVDTRSSSTAPAEPQSRWAFPLHRIHWGQLAAALVALTAVTALVGWLLTDALAPNEITEFDDEVAQRLVDSRTATRTDAARWGAHIADTEVKIIVTALLAVGAIALWRRWHEALLIVAALVMEATAFIVASFIVARPRPNVPRLLDSPVDSSFPSGHVAAATVYSVVVVIVCVALPLIVGWARMYQGMHFLSDVVAGMILGVATVAVCALIIPRPTDSPTDPELAGRRVDADEPVATAAAD